MRSQDSAENVQPQALFVLMRNSDYGRFAGAGRAQSVPYERSFSQSKATLEETHQGITIVRRPDVSGS